MTTNFKKTIAFFAGLILLCGFAPFSVGQKQKVQTLEQQITSFAAESLNVHVVLQQFAKEYNVPIGFEAVPEEMSTRENRRIRLKVDKGTVRDALDSIVQAEPRYKWKEVDGVINVIPKVKKESLLDTVVYNFQVYNMNRKQATHAVINLPEVQAKMQELGLTERSIESLPAESEDKLPQFSLDLHNVTARTILNEIMKAGEGNYWIFYRYGDHDQYLSIRM